MYAVLCKNRAKTLTDRMIDRVRSGNYSIATERPRTKSSNRFTVIERPRAGGGSLQLVREKNL
jgi:hypothetical protein